MTVLSEDLSRNKEAKITTLEYTIYLIGKESNLPRLSRSFADPENKTMR